MKKVMRIQMKNITEWNIAIKSSPRAKFIYKNMS